MDAFERKDLRGADLQGYDFQEADLIEANLESAFLGEAYGLSLDQLSKVKTLYDTKLDEKLLIQLKEKYPILFEETNG